MDTIVERLTTFVDHKSACDFVQPMWHKGPCDCGLHKFFAHLDTLEHPSQVVEEIKASEVFLRWKNRPEHER